MISHTHDDCVGHWTMRGDGIVRYLECSHCPMRYPETEEYRIAAVDENYAGIYLRRLTAEGARRP